MAAPPTPDEHELILDLRDPTRREAAFRRLVVTQGPLLFRHLSRMLPERQDVDDVLQETFVKAWNKLDRFRGESKLSTWLYRIATNEALSLYRRRKRRPTVVTDVIPPQAESAAMGGEQIERIFVGALELLAPKQRAVFSMRYFDEMPYRQISEVTGTSVGSLKASYHQAVKKIETAVKMYANEI